MRHQQRVAAVLLGLGLGACGTSPESGQAVPPTPVLNVRPDPIRIGEQLTVELGASGTAGEWSVALFLEGSDGKIDQLLPNRLSPEFKVTTGTTAVFPGPAAPFKLMAGAPAGNNTLLLLLSPRPVVLEGISRYNEQAVFATVQRRGVGVLLGEVKQELLRLNPGSGVTDRTLTIRP